MPTRTFLCRCEDVTLAEVDHAFSLGLVTIEEIKRYTGLGTGPCQGKECVCVLASLLVDRGLTSAEHLQPFTARPPTEPVTLGALSVAADDPLTEGPLPRKEPS